MVNKELRRGAALQKIVQLRERQKTLNQNIASLERHLEDLSRKYQPLIGQLQERVDRLASKFRKFYRESQDAFQEGDGELAKSLSIEGREAQDECERLNSQANGMRYELKNLQDRVARMAGEFNDNETRISKLKAVLKPMRRPNLAGFERSGIPAMSLEQFLDKLPQLALREIERIEPIPERQKSIEGGGKLGDTSWNPETRKATIRVYLHELEFRGREHETIIHEVGHEIFLKLIAQEEKMAWEELHRSSGDWFVSSRAIRSVEEDFCECFAVFFGDHSSELARRDSKKYTFIKNLVKRLEKNYEKTQTSRL